jgi:hypothetical protein
MKLENIDVPVSFVYGGKDWMDVKGGQIVNPAYFYLIFLSLLKRKKPTSIFCQNQII